MDDAVTRLYDILNNLISNYVPCSVKAQTKSRLAWMNDRCTAAVLAKHKAEGTDSYVQVAKQCQTILHEEQVKYNKQLRKRMEGLPRNSKPWWTIAKQLLRRNSATFSRPSKIMALGSGSRRIKLTPSPKSLIKSSARTSIFPRASGNA